MTRLTDLPPAQSKRLAAAECPKETSPWVTGRLYRTVFVSCSAKYRRPSALREVIFAGGPG